MKSTVFTIVNILFLSGVLVSAKELISRDTSVAGYVDQGCYTEATTGRALSDYAYYDNGMTVQKCATACADYNWFGVEYGDECYCGDSINVGSIPAPQSDCSFQCPGDSSQTCGAGNRLNMYSKSSLTEFLSTYIYMGCYTEGNNVRALPLKITQSNDMTVELCASTCKGYALFSVEYYDQCYCGDVLEGGSEPTAESECSFPCLGDTSEMCGSNWVMNLYSFDTSTTTLSSSNSATSTTSSVSTSSTSAMTAALSSESSTTSGSSSNFPTTSSSSPSSSALNSSPSASFTTSLSSSSSSSLSISTSASSSLPLVTQSSSLSSSSVSSSSLSSSLTSMIPSTSSSSTRTTSSTTPTPSLGVKATIDSYSYIGCYTEATNIRALSQSVSYDYRGMTLEICSTYCYGYKYFGVEYGGECYCGNFINQGSVPAPRTDCAIICPGNDLEYCGDGNRLDMYELATAIPTSPSTVQTTSSPAITTLGIKQKVGDYEYQGCYTEATNMRALTGAAHYDYPAMTLEECAADCDGFTYFGVEYGGECYCGDSLNPGSVITDDSRCSFICPGDQYEYCGASLLLDLYKLGPPGPIHLALYVQPIKDEATKEKRTTYNTPIIVTSGGLVADCTDANYFYIVNGSLYEEELLVGVKEGLPSDVFWGTNAPGPKNESFPSGEASFCILDETIIAVFNGIIPSSCTPVNIGVASFADFCPGGTATPTATFQPVVPTATAASTPVLPTCTAGSDPETNITVIPAADPGANLASPLNLSPSSYATLYYAEPAPGTTVLEVEYAMLYPQITLENSNLIDNITCDATTISMNFTTSFAFLLATQWPQSNFVLITNTPSCNPSQQRAVYMVNSYTSDSTSQSITFQVIEQTWSDVAETMEISYETGVISSNTTSSFMPTCSSPVTPSTPASTNTGISYADLTPEEKAIVALLTANNTYDANGNLANTVSASTDDTATPSAFNPNPDPAAQAALEDALQKAGLPSPGALHNTTSLYLAGHCTNGAYVPPSTIFSKRNQVRAQVRKPRFPDRQYAVRKRDQNSDDEDSSSWWQCVWDGLCDNTVDDIIDILDEDLGAFIDAICALKQIYDDLDWAYKNRNAIKCTVSGCYISVPVSKYWQFSESMNADFYVPPQPLAEGSTGTISCVDCSLTVSNISYSRRVTVALTDGSLISAYMTPTVSWSGNVVMSMSATGPFSGEWNYAFNSLSFPSPIVVANQFSISTSMIYSLGVGWSTDSAVDITGGGSVSVNSGSLNLDFQGNNASQASNWNPTVQFTYPMFSTASTVFWNPIMRSSIEMDVSIFNSAIESSPMYLTSASSLGFNAALIETDGGYCPAGQLMMTSYSSITNAMQLNSKGNWVMWSDSNVPGETLCFEVPNDIPTVDEVNELRSSGAKFCTNYLDYTPHTAVDYAATTVTSPSTVTTTVPTTISTPVYVYTSPIVWSVSTQTTISPTPIYAYTSGSQSLGDAYLRKRAFQTPAPTTLQTATKIIRPTPPNAPSHHHHTKRYVNGEPAFISTWDAKKISNACSQIATGTSTTTYYTSTSTFLSGAVTATATTTVDVAGLATTYTYPQIIWSVTATTVTEGGPATVTTASSCPLQTQITCFTLTGHGAPHIDGKQFYMADGPPEAGVFGGWGYDTNWDVSFEVGIFYLTCEGALVNLQFNKALIPQTIAWAIFPPWDGGATGQTCTQDTVAKTLTCGAGWFSYTPNVYNDQLNTNAWQPLWNADGSDYFGELTPIVLTYDEVTCPCAY